MIHLLQLLVSISDSSSILVSLSNDEADLYTLHNM